MIGRAQLSEIEEHLENSDDALDSKNIADQIKIRRVVDEIDNQCDLKNWEKCRSFFTDEIEVNFTSLNGGEPGKMKADNLIGDWRTNLFEAKKTCHLRSNHSIKIDGDSAEVFSKAYAFNLLETGEVKGLWEVWGNYTHNLTRTKNGWKVSMVTLEVIYQRGDEKVRTYLPEK
jgi:hypothetical protein